jgi:hypothetical protein
MKTRMLVIVSLLLVAGAASAGSSIKANLSSIPDRCVFSSVCANNGAPCSIDQDCDLGRLSTTSKVSLGGNGKFKIKVSGVVNSAGMPATGEYMLYYSIGDALGATSDLPIKVPVVSGKGSASADLSSFLAVGERTKLTYGVTFGMPPEVPAECPGTNSPADIQARIGDADCNTVGVIAWTALDAEEKTRIKTSVGPIEDRCESGSCAVNTAQSCTTNTDCKFGSVSAKSKFSLDGEGSIKVQVKDVLDSAGLPATGEYLLFIDLYLYDDGGKICTVKVPVVDGKAKTEADIGPLLATGDNITNLSLSYLTLPAAVPANCPGDNTAASIEARRNDPDCYGSAIVGGVGLVVDE